ncbi:hypothetical protein IAT38_005152 [Cryptococcus sp. DSM 104549]
MTTHNILLANQASPSKLAPNLPRLSHLPSGDPYTTVLVPSAGLSAKSQDVLFRIMDRNMRAIQSKSSFPYTESDKREEMFDPTSRFILLLPGDRVDAFKALEDAAESVELKDDDEQGLLGFAEFRFDTEETMEGSDVEVVYCYEVQLQPQTRGAGLGKVLMDLIDEIGKRRGMAKTMLTCLKSNTSALRFYEKSGYTPDEIDPTRVAAEYSDDDEDEDADDEEADYVILSKELKRV